MEAEITAVIEIISASTFQQTHCDLVLWQLT